MEAKRVQLLPPTDVSVRCVPTEGYHFEEHRGGRAAVHDIATPALRQRDLDTADGWYGLTNKQRQQILDGKPTIYDFVEKAHD
jgi:hypothetical protein